jgi:hypothetical protein
MQLLRAPGVASLGASASSAFRTTSGFRPRTALRRRACAATTRAANQDDSFRAGSASSLSAGEAMKARFPAQPRCLRPAAAPAGRAAPGLWPRSSCSLSRPSRRCDALPSPLHGVLRCRGASALPRAQLLGLHENASAEEIVAAKNISIGRNPDASHVQRVRPAARWPLLLRRRYRNRFRPRQPPNPARTLKPAPQRRSGLGA